MHEAKALEESYDWSVTCAVYDEVSKAALSERDWEFAAESQRRLGRCYRKAAFQSPESAQFSRLINKSSSSYRRASNLYAKLKGRRAAARALDSRSGIDFADHYLAGTTEARRRLLESSLLLERRAVEAFDRVRDPDWPDACIALLNREVLVLDFTWDVAQRRKTVEHALAFGREAVQSLSDPGHKRELSWVHLLLGIVAGSGVYLMERPSDREALRADSIAYARSALALSGETGDAELRSRASLSMLSREGYTRRSPAEFHRYLQDALESARTTKDTELIADALTAKAYDQVWEMAAEEFPDGRLTKFAECKSTAAASISKYRAVLNHEGVSTSMGSVLAQAYYRLSLAELDRTKRKKLLDAAISSGREALSNFRRSGGVNDDTPAHTLAMALYQSSLLGMDQARKARLLREALRLVEETYRHRDATTPFHKWNRGVTMFHEAEIRAELSMTGVGSKRVALLRSAAETMRSALTLCKAHYATSERIPQQISVGLGTYASRLYEILDDLSRLSPDPDLQGKAISAIKEASAFYAEGGWPSRAAEAHWRLAQFLDSLGQQAESSREFESAAESYKAAGEKTEQFRGFYDDYHSYMISWSAIEKGRLDALMGRYGSSSDHYRDASERLSRTNAWKELSGYYKGWSKLESAEALSSQGSFKEAVKLFKEGAESFAASQAAFVKSMAASSNAEEREQWQDLSTGAAVRSKYCEGRVFLEEAKILDASGEISKSAEAYARASEAFASILPGMERSEAREISSMVELSKGWQLMKRAEELPSLSLYMEAAKAFNAAARYAPGSRLATVGTANAHFSQGMHSTLQFSESGEDADYSRAKAELEGAKSGYLSAGLEKAADWTEAAMLLLDGRIYSIRAEKTVDPTEKGRFYQSAERSLELAATLCTRAGYPERRREVEKDIGRVKQKLALVSNLAEVSSVPVIATTATPYEQPLREDARGLAAFERANIQAHLRVEREIEVGETTQIQLDLYNTGSRPAALLEVRDLFSAELVPTNIPTSYELVNRSLKMRGKQIEPLQVESILIPVEARGGGEVALSPKLAFLDDRGKLNLQALEGTMIRVVAPETFEFKRSETGIIFEALIEAFVEDHMRRRLYVEQAGWRSLSQVAKDLKVAPSTLYGRDGRYGAVLYELLARGLVETRTFKGERGRGGSILKARIAYEKDAVKRYVDRRIMKGIRPKNSASKNPTLGVD